MILFFDTETTGKADFKRPPDHPCQPRLVSLSAILCSPTGQHGICAELDLAIKPDGFIIPPEAAAIHGITQESAMEHGVPVSQALKLFHAFLSNCDFAVAFNSAFDNFILDIEHTILDVPFDSYDLKCAMLRAKDHCKIPGQYGDWKWPKLQEAHQHFFGQPFDGAHSSLADVKATARVWFEMDRLDKEAAANLHPNPEVGSRNSPAADV